MDDPFRQQGNHSPSHGAYHLNTTYQPPADPGIGYMPPPVPAADASNPFAADNLFGASANGGAAHPDASNPFAGSAAGAAVPAVSHSEVVPAVDQHTTVTIGQGSSGHLPFQESNLPSHGVHGKISSPDQVPRVHSYPDNRNLFQGQAPSAPLGGPGGAAPVDEGRFSVFSFKRYRKYFNVDTSDVLVRMRDSVVGSYRADFLEKTAASADLYGPFWVASTLIFVSAVTGNYASYVSYRRTHAGAASAPSSAAVEEAWYYDVNKVGYSAALFYGYVGGLGLALYACLRWFFSSQVTLAQVWCTYGYALTIFIPISFFCVFPYEGLRWGLVAAATATSGLFLLTNFRRPIFESAGARATPVFLAVGAAHVALGLVLKLYFFHYW